MKKTIEMEKKKIQQKVRETEMWKKIKTKGEKTKMVVGLEVAGI